MRGMFYLIQTPDQLSVHLRALRTAKRWNQAELGAKLGLTQTRISRIENDPLSVSVKQLMEVLRVLDADLVLAPTHQEPNPAPSANKVLKHAW
jgi:HTH-type transcriptional regulator/antitoxin HipB